MESRLITCLVSFVHFGIWSLCTHCGLSGSLWFFLNAPQQGSRTIAKKGNIPALGPPLPASMISSLLPGILIMAEGSLEVDLKFINITPVLRTMPGILTYCMNSLSICGIKKHRIGLVDHAALSWTDHHRSMTKKYNSCLLNSFVGGGLSSPLATWSIHLHYQALQLRANGTWNRLYF